MSTVAESGFGYAEECMLWCSESPPRCRHRDRTHNITWPDGNAVLRMSLPTTSPSCTACQESKHAEEHACWRRETCSESGEKPPTTKQQHTTSTQPNGPGRMKDGGHEFETQIAALLCLRGLQTLAGNFELSCKRDDAGNLDNLVYTVGGQRYFLLLKHVDNMDKKGLTTGEILPLLQKCFELYCDIKRGEGLEDIPFDKTEFILYTNRGLDSELSQHKVFSTCGREMFIFIPDKNRESQIYTLLEDLVKGSEGFRGSCDREMVSEFFNKFIIVTCQKGKRQLDGEICKEIKEHDSVNVAGKVFKEQVRYFKTRIETSLRNRKDGMTAHMVRNWLQEAKTKAYGPLVSSLCARCTKNLARTGIHFSNSEISRLQAELYNKRAVHLRSDALTLCSILLLDCLPISKCIFVNFKSLQSDRTKLLHAWLGGDWQWFVVSCDSNIQEIRILEMCRSILKLIKLIPSNKCLIILTPCSVQPIQAFTAVAHKFKFKHLCKTSQEIVLNKQVDFQGREVTMGSILQRHRIVQRALGADIVKELVTKGSVKLGGRLRTNTGYYAPRVLEREVWLQLDILRDPDSYPYVFAVSGMEVEDLVAIVPPGDTVKYIDEQNVHHIDFTENTCSRFILLSEACAEFCFLELCKKRRGRTLHWVQFHNGNLRWKKSCGGPGKLLNYTDTERTRLYKQHAKKKYIQRRTCEISEESIWDLGERTVLVVAEPGMGKSSTTTQVARHTKERDPTSWVVRINWNDHSGKLQEIDAATFNFDSLVEFLCSAAFPDSKYTDINRSLLKQALQKIGNVTVLMDGFDEITPTYADKALVILKELLMTKVGRVWVASRPVHKERLEKELSVTAYGMKKLSHEAQVQVLLKLSMFKHIRNKEQWVAPINRLLTLVNQSVSDSNFTGSPLYIKMITTAYRLDIRRWIRLGFPRLPPEIDLVCLCDKFVASKLHISQTQKERVDITNDSILDNHERLKEILLEDFERCALVATLHPSVLELLHNKKIQEQIQPFLGMVQAGNEKTGVVMNVVDGKPQFVHRTFAEYFTARWLSKNFESNRSVLEHILFDRTYRVVRDMFDRMMAKGSPLHCAVLNRDSGSVETLLEGGCDINALDKGGRTVIHIIAIHSREFPNIADLVLHYEASLDRSDCVLQWTPLQYAIKSEDWAFVELLLENKVDRAGLDMIRQRAHDPDYIGPIIIDAARNGHLSLLEFLCSIGVNIHQAHSRSFHSPLHAAVEGIKPMQVIRLLIKHGADCNTRYSDGRTPLFHAVTEGSLDVVRALVEEGSASLDVRDDCGRTAIDWVKHYTSDPKNRDSVVWNGDIQRLKEIVKFLQERGCRQRSSVRWNGDS